MTTSLPPELMIPVLNGLGAIIKHAVPKIDNRWIPVILAIVGTGLTVLVSPEITALVIVRGFAVSAAAVGLHQIGKGFLPQK